MRDKTIEEVIDEPMGEDVVEHIAYQPHGPEMFVQIEGKWYLLFETPGFDPQFYWDEDEE